MKLNFKLNQYLLIIFVGILFLLLFLFITQYYLSKVNIQESFTNKIYKDSLHIREDFRLTFDRLQYDFKEKRDENINKLDIALEYIDNNKDFTADELEKELNKNITFGKYEVFIINKDYIIEQSSYKPDIGLDFKNFKTIKVLFDSIVNEEIKIDVSPPKVDSASMNLKRYLVKLSKDKTKLIQIGFVLDSYKIIKQKYKSLKYLANDIELSLATRYSIQPIDLKSESFQKTNLTKDWEHSVSFLKKLSENMTQFKDRVDEVIATNVKEKSLVLNNELSKIFQDNNKLLVSVDSSKKLSTIYSITNGVFNDNDETKLLIKTTFKNDELINSINKSFFSLFYVYLVLLGVLILVYKFMLKNVSSKLLNIIKYINHNDKSYEEGIIIDEIRNLQDDYNKLHDKLNNEVNKNKLLLSQNKEFIADMVHQIRTPLSVIMTNTNLIEMTQGNKHTKEFIDSINSSINMLSNSYEDLSFVVSNDTIEYKPKILSLSKLLKDRCEFFRSIAHSRKRDIIDNIESEVNIFINEIELERLIDNNLSNCIKYSNPDSTIKVSLKKQEGSLILSFLSQGRAIENKDKLFDRYYRENESQRGSGIGLNIVKNVCDKYNIDISINSSNDINTFTYVIKI